MKRRKFILSLAGTAAAGVAGWRLSSHQGRAKTGAVAGGNLAKVTRTSWALGTNISLTLFHRDADVAERAASAAFKGIDEVESIMSLYRADSEVSRLNRDKRLASPDPALVRILETAQALSRETRGAFDITVQPLWQVYYSAYQSGVRASGNDIRGALAKVGWQRVRIQPSLIELKGEGTEITLNGIAQGYAADVVADILGRHGVELALIDTGEINAMGSHAEKEAWTIGIKDPRREGSFMGVADLKGRSLATSGDYETHFDAAYLNHHLLDPHTGHSPRELSSVSVAAPTALEADALSTAVFLLGMEKGRRLVESRSNVDALFVTKDGRRVRTSGFPFSEMV